MRRTHLYLASALVAAGTLTAAGQASADGALSTPAGAAFAGACAGLGFENLNHAGDPLSSHSNTPATGGCQGATSAVGGSTSISTSHSGTSNGNPFNASATTTAGPKTVHMVSSNASNTATEFSAGFTEGGVSGQLNPTGAALIKGAQDYLVIPVLMTGTITAFGVGGDSILQLTAYVNGIKIDSAEVPNGGAAFATFSNLNSPLYGGSPSGETWDYENVAWRAVDYGADPETLRTVSINKTIDFVIPFSVGTAFDVAFFGTGEAGETSEGGSLGPETTSMDTTFTWQGGGYILTSTGQTITDFSLNPDAPGGGVPEPASWALMLTGFAGLGSAIRRARAHHRAATA